MRRSWPVAALIIGSMFAVSCSWTRSDWKASISPDGGWCEGVSTTGLDFIANYTICADGSNGLGFSFKGANSHLESIPLGHCEVDSYDKIRCPVYIYVSLDGGDFNMLEGDNSGMNVGFNPKFIGRVLEAKQIRFRYINEEGKTRVVKFHVAGFPAARRKELLKKGL